MPAMKRVVDSSIVQHEPAFSEDLIAWQKQHGRHQLPWQQTRDAYRIWLSEIMLQQTQVTTVIPYYHRFLQQFPDVRALAAAPVDQVMSLWAFSATTPAHAICIAARRLSCNNTVAFFLPTLNRSRRCLA
jgi:hypothetical protein